ncbi:MAG: 30S ribosome-binding factor RbfA [Clostridia bacterium]|nr:30S ribosome-binding factor RbfA [Clostridia bacterium]
MATQQFERTDRISSEMMREIERVIREEVNDPRTDCLFSITHVDVTRDLRYAKVYISIYEEDKRTPMLKALKGAAGFIRHEVGTRIQLRYTPELLFHLDTSIEYGVHIAEVLSHLETGSREPDEKETKDEE